MNKVLSILSTGLLALLVSGPAAAASIERGEACLRCHGDQLQGRVDIGTPGLAGQNPDYLRRQLNKFAEGHRGLKEGDAKGALMQSMDILMQNKSLIDEYLAFIARFPPAEPEPYTLGNAEAGRDTYFYTCGVCHGQDAKGSVQYDAPNLLVIGGDYFFHQVKKFKNAQRGDLDDDIHAIRMWAMAQVIESDEQLRDVIAYVESLRGDAKP